MIVVRAGPDLSAARAARERLRAGWPSSARETGASPEKGGHTVATVGFFDGVHRGHQRVLGELGAWAREAGGLPAVVTFDVHPQVVLGRRPPATISGLKHRLLLLARSGIELVLVLGFDGEIASWSPEEFARRVLHEALGSRRLLLGFDSALGRGRAGTFDYLKAREAELGLEVRRGQPLLLEGARVSSTLVREAVAAGDLAGLEALLGRPFSLLGEVAPGDRRGRELGFPTANLALREQFLPPSGVYFAEADRVSLPRDLPEVFEVPPGRRNRFPAVVNIGRRPTFAGPQGSPPFNFSSWRRTSWTSRGTSTGATWSSTCSGAGATRGGSRGRRS